MTNPRGKYQQNKLAQEKSPYLLQHADNPVEWYAWTDEAFERAEKEDKPIFLSIGYSTCHWCHVMAHESFEDEEIANLMNDTFVNIKVDREERPDIDGVYMQIAQMMTGSGGWPLTIIMTPNKKPFYAATYIPKKTQHNMIGLIDLIPRIKAIWQNDKANINEVITRVEAALKEPQETGFSSVLDVETINLAFNQLSQRFDDKHGGFGRAPKFPSPHNLMFLLRFWKKTNDDWALKMVEETLISMRQGGVYDHIGFGFHRYSTDAKWLLPHFEKMLYDQASLMMAYTEAFQITNNARYADVIEEIATYVKRDLMSTEGVFYSAEDADSEGIEGKFYVWSYDEIKEVLTSEEFEIATKYFNIKQSGNFSDEATQEETGLNILHTIVSLDKIADTLKKSEKDTQKVVTTIMEKLFNERQKRIRPHRDEKILTDWNSFMIAALAKAGIALDNQELIKTAERAMDFLLNEMIDDAGRVYHRYRDGERAITGFLDDYSFLIWALLELYESTFKTEYLERAKALTDDMLKYFWDDENGGLFFTATYAEELLSRRKDAYDGAMPSGNSVAVLSLIRLARMLGDNLYEERASETIHFFAEDINRAHSAYTMMLCGLDFILGPSFEVVIAGNPEQEDTKRMLKEITHRFLPRKIVLLRGTKEQSDIITKLAPFTKFHEPLNGITTAHVCIDHNCKLPTTDLEKMLMMLGES